MATVRHDARKKYRHELRYDAAPEVVHAMLADRVFREKVCVAMATISHEVTIDRRGEGMSVRIDMLQNTQGIPAVAKRIVGDKTRVVQSEEWRSPTAAELLVEIPGRPGSLTGTISLAADGSGSVEVVEGDLEVAIPVIGGKLAKLIGNLLDDALDTEQEVGRSWLAENHH